MLVFSEEFDLKILKDYNEEVNAYYKLNSKNNSSYIADLPCRLDIQSSEVDHFIKAWNILMERFKIPLKHHNNLLFILQSFYSISEANNQHYYDATQAISILTFFIEYYEAIETIKPKRGQTLMSKTELANNKLQVQVGVTGTKHVVKLRYMNTSSMMDLIFKSVKSQDMLLREIFPKVKSLPPKQDLIEAKTQLEKTNSLPYQYLVIEVIETLNRFIKDHLLNELQGKVHLFLFEILYLFDFIKYTGKVKNMQARVFALPVNAKPADKFAPLSHISDHSKMAIIQAILNKLAQRKTYHTKRRVRIPR